jgi:choline dehydrogenase-like flavoprotein
VLDPGAQILVDLDVAALDGQAVDAVQTDGIGQGLAPDRDQDDVALDLGALVPLVGGDGEADPVVAALDRVWIDARGGVDLHAALAERACQLRADLGVLERHDAVRILDQLHLAAEVAVHAGPLDADGTRAVSLDLRSMTGGHASVRADRIVLCAGGIENARLLLTSGGIGNANNLVGRYLADHPRAAVARFDKAEAATIARHFGFFGLARGRPTRFYLHGLSLSPHVQAREGLLNCATYPVQELADDDPWLALKRLRDGGWRGHLVPALSSPALLVMGLYRRLVLKQGLPRKMDGIRFDVMVEQCPNPESRVTLSSRCDALGMPVARVDWKISALETASVMRLATLMLEEFTRVGLPRPQLADWILRDDPSGAAFSDMAHPAGTTRMGHDPLTSVVNQNARVHGVENLYLAGSSVFPTPGHANPTLMIVALSIRLADHLKESFGSACPPQPRLERGRNRS